MSYVYLAYPIDRASFDSAESISAIKDGLIEAGISYFSPGEAWHAASTGDGIQTANESVLAHAAVVLAVITKEPSIGVPAELMLARQFGIPAVVYVQPGVISGHVLPTLATAGIYITETQAITAAKRLIQVPSISRRRGAINRDDSVRHMPLPAQAKTGDVGLDLYVSDDITIPSHEWRGVKSRVRVAPPSDIWFLIAGRSSALHRRGLQVQTSIIDSGFRGDLVAFTYNSTSMPVVVPAGDRIAQLIPLPVIPFEFEEMEWLPPSERGADGFGSTGA